MKMTNTNDAPVYIQEYFEKQKTSGTIQNSIFEDDMFIYEPCEDRVESPSHYTAGGIETIDFIRAKLTPEEFRGYCKGNIIKYLSRCGRKKSAPMGEDVQKAAKYMQWLEENVA